ncbi:VrrA/YqfQ family protein [Oceanobacillus rekensis]|uniref:VrrA/YqfQ family protein n=1 Tax=Oceanobacillus rekensis TaxID=937927 RepID=UPI0015944373|nr:VrrA/YqfQ family protein [Oceanobacillus rekensis]
MIFPPGHQRQYPNPMERNMRNKRTTMKPSNFNTKSIGSSSVGGITKTLDNVQQVLNMVQSSAPFIQEYGPMIKNLPAMYRMMKAFKEIESSEDDTKQIADSDEKNKTEPVIPEYQPTKTKSIGESKPKLYI